MESIKETQKRLEKMISEKERVYCVVSHIFYTWGEIFDYAGIKRNKLVACSDSSKTFTNKVIASMRRSELIVKTKKRYFLNIKVAKRWGLL
jgi:hypothetical protein